MGIISKKTPKVQRQIVGHSNLKDLTPEVATEFDRVPEQSVVVIPDRPNIPTMTNPLLCITFANYVGNPIINSLIKDALSTRVGRRLLDKSATNIDELDPNNRPHWVGNIVNLDRIEDEYYSIPARDCATALIPLNCTVVTHSNRGSESHALHPTSGLFIPIYERIAVVPLDVNQEYGQRYIATLSSESVQY